MTDVRTQATNEQTERDSLVVQQVCVYIREGLSVAPVKPGTKHPTGKWRKYQTERMTEQEAREIWGKDPALGIFIITGQVSGNLVVVDVDDSNADDYIQKSGGLPPGPWVRTGRGKHYYLKAPLGKEIRNKNFRSKNPSVAMDVKAEGGGVIAPPSIHSKTGEPYEWELGLGEFDIPTAPEWLLRELAPTNGKPAISVNLPGWEQRLIGGVEAGKRNDALAKLVGKYIQRGLSFDDVLLLAQGWNQRNKPPLPDEEVVRTVHSVFETHERNHPAERERKLVFPEECICGVAGEFAKLYGSHLESPEHFFFMAFLTALGSILSGRLTLATEIYPQPRLFTLLLGESGDSRKTTAITKTVKFFRDTRTDFVISWGVNSDVGLQKSLMESNRLLLCLDEFKAFISKCGIQNSALLACTNTLFESNSYQSRTKDHDLRFENAHLVMLAASTVETYERTWDPAFTDIGFGNRLFLVPGHGERKYSLPSKVPVSDVRRLQTLLDELFAGALERRELPVTLEAHGLYDAWYREMPQSVHSTRLDNYATRLMVLFAANEMKPEVDEEIVRKVLAVADWQLQVRKRHDPIDADTKVAQMEERIRRALADGPLKDWKLKQRVHANRAGLWCYNSAKKNLEREGEVQWDKQKKTLKLL